MKANLLIALALATTLITARAETWTSSDGRTANMTLVEVTEEDGEKVGKFKLRNGKTTTIKASGLSEADAKRLAEWVDPNAPEPAGPESVFDDVLEGNLLRLDGKSLKKCEDATQPQKYYVFYYTASWCPPCQAFTPSLVDWYNDNKNDNFELVLITSDRDEDSMEGYAKDKKMPWPQLKLKDASKFKSKFNHGVSGIPSLIVCDLEGKNLGNFRGNLPGLTDLVKD
ncbi:thioredoxin-like domain-containing protein [Haloferula rosea]|uniref:Redoxin domain-containing protein n=1 Tax=Haloferula rosea TaxID=490093 RepID=A0A934RHV6_9BACT|nr:thioredoxin-like domain-containing protein [Haloferula rosea]MBK1828816.1 redoxin domain-containing protein [Haloferula rosea]